MKATFEIFKKNSAKIFILSLIILIPVYVFQEFVLFKYIPTDLNVMNTNFMWFMIVNLLLSCVVTIFKICVIKISFDELSGSANTVSDIMEYSLKIWPKCLLTVFLWSIFIAFGFMLFVLPGIIFYILYFYNQHVVIKDGIWGKKALFVSQLYAKKKISNVIKFFISNLAVVFVCEGALAIIEKNITGNYLLSAALCVLCGWLTQILSSVIDIRMAVYLNSTKIDFDLNVLKKQKSDLNE